MVDPAPASRSAASDLSIAEVPAWRHAVAVVLLMGEGGAAPWCVRWRARGERRSRILETFDSRYAAEQGLVRYQAVASKDGPSGLLRESASSRGPFRRPFSRLRR